MREFSVTNKEKFKNMDKTIVICVAILSLLSLSTLFGGYLAGGCSKFTVSRVFTQTFSVAVGSFIMFFFSFLDYDMIIGKTVKGIYVLIIGMLIFLVLFGQGEMGNKNWIYLPGIPFNIQPSEFCKPLFIITFSKHISSLKRSINHPLSLLQLACHAGLIIGLLAFTKDLGTILVYIFIIVIMLFSAGLSLWYFIGGAAAVLLAFPFVSKNLDIYQQERIRCGFDPTIDPVKYGYQALKSKAAISNGGFIGNGIAGGEVYKKLPECQSDFLFAVLVEKFGFMGGLLFLTAMTVLIIRLLFIAKQARKDYAATICVGVAAMLLVQTTENIGMCLAFLPVIGITLPFISYGGSSILSCFISMGIVMSINTHRKKYYFEREDP